jgi:hypothetical protein
MPFKAFRIPFKVFGKAAAYHKRIILQIKKTGVWPEWISFLRWTHTFFPEKWICPETCMSLELLHLSDKYKLSLEK